MSMPADAPSSAEIPARTCTSREEDRLLPQIDHLTVAQLRRRAADHRDDARCLNRGGATNAIAMLIADAERCENRANALEAELAREVLGKPRIEAIPQLASDATRPREHSARLQANVISQPLRRQGSCIEGRAVQGVSVAKLPESTASNDHTAPTPLSPRTPYTANEVPTTALQALPRG